MRMPYLVSHEARPRVIFYCTLRVSAVCIRGDVGMQAPHMRVKRREKIKIKNKKMPGKDVKVGTYVSNTLGITHMLSVIIILICHHNLAV